MLRTMFVPGVVSALLAALTSAQAHAYGAYRAGYTAVSPTGGVQHYGSTTASGRYGTVSHTGSTTGGYGGVAHTGTTTATGASGGTYQHTGTRVYSPTAYNGYSGAGSVTHTGSTTATGAAGGTYQRSGATTVNPYGGVSHSSNATATGAAGGTYAGSSSRVYSPTTYQGYSAAGATGTGYRAGVVRYP